MGDRFDHLESGDPAPERSLPDAPRLNRFDYLEIGELPPQVSAPAPTPSQDKNLLCPHCGQANEAVREVCWACCKPMTRKEPPPPPAEQPLELVLDGKHYVSTDPALPPDVAELMRSIRERGYTPQLLSEWRQWRATRNVGGIAAQAGPAVAHPDVKLFRGQRVSVLRIDGKTYTSDMKDLPPDVKDLFDYLRFNEVTPELMDHLRRFGSRVKFRPFTAPNPSDGEVGFWKEAASALKEIF
jgi:hypothetical protein